MPGQPVGKAVVLATATMCLRGALSDPEGVVSEIEPPPSPPNPPTRARWGYDCQRHPLQDGEFVTEQISNAAYLKLFRAKSGSEKAVVLLLGRECPPTSEGRNDPQRAVV